MGYKWVKIRDNFDYLFFNCCGKLGNFWGKGSVSVENLDVGITLRVCFSIKSEISEELEQFETVMVIALNKHLYVYKMR
ncbi:MAG: hypothetical protein BRC53_07865 [Cyanobacteria bacterium SW_6_48_11]|nr:MAG: hypothetical protein BRC36_07940 [Cyanobacteria bacterium QH_2_48_84]PSO89150.1 MAG: hypothetical protein BRC43_05205 [Cyanobacteria bacterium QS_3_48_167]PSO96992.1 MAG: hypothetical protein BRC53_07865 [Cyanobacteria bacterium SW_6_48_11]PSP01708.1 MAG: hypothetical protein BRC51_12895 [Cyanobacteria bacterium SW_12_48_29]